MHRPEEIVCNPAFPFLLGLIRVGNIGLCSRISGSSTLQGWKDDVMLTQPFQVVTPIQSAQPIKEGMKLSGFHPASPVFQKAPPLSPGHTRTAGYLTHLPQFTCLTPRATAHVIFSAHTPHVHSGMQSYPLSSSCFISLYCLPWTSRPSLSACSNHKNSDPF